MELREFKLWSNLGRIKCAIQARWEKKEERDEERRGQQWENSESKVL